MTFGREHSMSVVEGPKKTLDGVWTVSERGDELTEIQRDLLKELYDQGVITFRRSAEHSYQVVLTSRGRDVLLRLEAVARVQWDVERNLQSVGSYIEQTLRRCLETAEQSALAS